MRCVLAEGETVYLKATCTKADSSAVLEISCYAKQVGLGSVPLFSTESLRLFNFTAPYAGEFSFEGIKGAGGAYASATLYDAAGEKKTLSYTGSTGYFSIRCRMQKGETVQLRVVCTLNDPTAFLNISCYSQQ